MIQTKRTIDEWFEIIIPDKWADLTLEELFRNVWNAPKKQTHSLRMEKAVLINGEPAIWTKPLQQAASLRIRFFTEADFGVIPSPADLSILYEDDHLLVVNKPAGMDTHPNSPEQTNTLGQCSGLSPAVQRRIQTSQACTPARQGYNGGSPFCKASLYRLSFGSDAGEKRN